MAAGITAYAANKCLDAMLNNTSFVVVQGYLKLHIGSPGATGTTNAATETTRKAANFALAASGSITSDADMVWTSIAGSQTATFFSMWDDVAAGNCLFTGTLTGNPYTAGDTVTISSGAATASLTIAS